MACYFFFFIKINSILSQILSNLFINTIDPYNIDILEYIIHFDKNTNLNNLWQIIIVSIHENSRLEK